MLKVLSKNYMHIENKRLDEMHPDMN